MVYTSSGTLSDLKSASCTMYGPNRPIDAVIGYLIVRGIERDED